MDKEKEAISASLESLIKDKEKSYLLFEKTKEKSRKKTQGGYSSVFKGRGMDFAELREYTPGDDTRLVDWRTTAKQNKTFTKVFHEERERQVWFLLDLRHSMRFATRQAFKSVIAAHITAMLSWYFYEKKDKIGGILLTDEKMQVLKPSHIRSKLMHFFQSISQATAVNRIMEPEETTSLALSCMKLKRLCRTGNYIFIISDYSDIDEQMLKNLSVLAKHNTMVMINIYDVLEGRCPIPAVYSVTNGKDVMNLDMTHPANQERYNGYFQKRQYMLKTFTTHYKIAYLPISTEVDYYKQIAESMKRKKR